MPETKLDIHCGEVDDKGRRLVVATYGHRQFTDRFDTDASFQRQKWRDEAIRRLGLRGPYTPEGDSNAAVHEELEAQLQHAVDDVEFSGDAKPLATANTVKLCDVQAKPIRWFWDQYWPAGAIVLLDGDPNEGKTQVALSVAAHHSRGDTMPPGCFPNGATPGNTLFLSAEDDLERTTKPRLEALGADMNRIIHMRTVTPWASSEPRMVQLPTDIAVIEQTVTENRVGLVVFDVLSAFIAEGYNMNSDGDMRRCLSPLTAMAERTQATVLLLRHMNKREGTRSMYRGGGSVAIVGAARAAFAVAPHPDDPTTKVFAAIKHNLGPQPHSLTYHIEAAGSVSRVVWGGQTELSAADVLKGGEGSGGDGGGKLEAAKSIIIDVLGNGSRGSNELEVAIKEAGISNGTYWKARKALGVTSQKTGYQGQWLLALPASYEGSNCGEF